MENRDNTKYQIFFKQNPTDWICCYHCSEPILEDHIVVAAANQREIPFHSDDCYEEFVYGMSIFYQDILSVTTNP